MTALLRMALSFRTGGRVLVCRWIVSSAFGDMRMHGSNETRVRRWRQVRKERYDELLGVPRNAPYRCPADRGGGRLRRFVVDNKCHASNITDG